MKRLLPLVALLVLASGCGTMETLSQVGTSVAVATGTITPDQAQSINRTVGALEKSFTDITPEQEYWIGRTVAATILARRPPLDRRDMTEYLNTVGQYLALCSDRPETYGGYHFLVMDSDDINAFAAPGGLILVSRGMLRCCRNEDELAAVLAHEIGHVELKHGLQAINKSRLTSALTILAAESVKNLGGQNLAELTRAFEGSISDITGTLVNSGYSRAFEEQADRVAIGILKRAGYSPAALTSLLQTMNARLKPGGADFAKTHPDPMVRVKAIGTVPGHQDPAPASPATREPRFAKAMKDV